MKKILTLLCLIGSVFTLQSCAQQAFYYPDQNRYGTPADIGLPYQNLHIPSTNQVMLHAWFVPAHGIANPKDALGTVVHFHGNAQNMSAHWHAVQFLPKHGFNVVLFDYRGYGQSTGKPNQQGLFDDSNAVLNHVRALPQINPDKLLIFGQSLGGTNAIATVGAGNRTGVKAVAIESTFSAYSAIANDKLSGAGILLRNTYSANRYIAHISPIPLLLIHGTHDNVIAHKHSEILFALAQQPKQLILVQGGQHLNLRPYEPQYEQILVNFFKQNL